MSKPKLLVGAAREKWLVEMRKHVIMDFIAGETIRQIANRHELDHKWVEQVIRDVVAKAKKEGRL